MDTLKSGWTPYVYYTTLYSIPPYTIFMRIYWAHFLRKVGKSEKETVVQGKKLNTGFSTEVQ